MEGALDLKEQLAGMGQNLIRLLTDSAPKVLAGLAVVVIGLIVAKILEVVIRGFLTKARFDTLLERLGVDPILKKVGITQPASRLVPRLIFYLLITLLIQTVAISVGLTPISDAIASFFAFLPNLVAAFLVFVLGSMAAQFAGTAVTRATADSGVEFAPALGRAVSAVVFFVVAIMAISQLKFDTDMIRLVSTGILVAFALAFGLSFGLGSRDITRNLLAGFYARKVLRVGDAIEVRGERGTLRAITPTQILIQKEDEQISLANTVLLDELVKQKEGQS